MKMVEAIKKLPYWDKLTESERKDLGRNSVITTRQSLSKH